MTEQQAKCRCGWNGISNHLCHRCGQHPGTQRFYLPTMRFSLAGAQLKFSMTETWGCDLCWAEFVQLQAAEPMQCA